MKGTQLEFGSLTDTLKDEQVRIGKEREAGTHCKACGQYAKVYPRQIHSTMAQALILAHRISLTKKDGVFHCNEIFDAIMLARGDFQKFAFWGLIESVAVDDPGPAKTSGLWRMTEKGAEFVKRRARVPKRVFVYDNKALGFSLETCDIVDCLGQKFSYAELMAS